jgi:hypothetical protein
MKEEEQVRKATEKVESGSTGEKNEKAPPGRKQCWKCGKVSFDRLDLCPSCGIASWWKEAPADWLQEDQVRLEKLATSSVPAVTQNGVKKKLYSFRSIKVVGTSREQVDWGVREATRYDMSSVRKHQLELDWREIHLQPAAILGGIFPGFPVGALGAGFLAFLPTLFIYMRREIFSDIHDVVHFPWMLFFYICLPLMLLMLPGMYVEFSRESGLKARQHQLVREERGTEEEWEVINEKNWGAFISSLHAQRSGFSN